MTPTLLIPINHALLCHTRSTCLLKHFTIYRPSFILWRSRRGTASPIDEHWRALGRPGLGRVKGIETLGIIQAMTDLHSGAEDSPPTSKPPPKQTPIPADSPELDEWGLPIRRLPPPISTSSSSDKDSSSTSSSPAIERPGLGTKHNSSSKLSVVSVQSAVERIEALRRASAEKARQARRGSQVEKEDSGEEEYQDAVEGAQPLPIALVVEEKKVEEAIECIKAHKVEEAAAVIIAAEAAHAAPVGDSGPIKPSPRDKRQSRMPSSA